MRSASDPRARKGKPLGGRNVSRDGRVREGGASARHFKKFVYRVRNMESGTAAAPTRDGGRDGSTIRLG